MKTKLLKTSKFKRFYPDVYLKDNDINDVVLNLDDKTLSQDKTQHENSLTNDICFKENITPEIFSRWGDGIFNFDKKCIEASVAKVKKVISDEKFRIVIEGKTGETSVGEICKREGITQDVFLRWVRDFRDLTNGYLAKSKRESLEYRNNKLLYTNRFNKDVFDYLDSYVDFSDSKLLTIENYFDFESETSNLFKNTICVQKLNDIRYINKFLEQVNSKLVDGGFFIGCLETLSARNKRKIINKIPIVNSFYFFTEFLLKRIAPKLSFTKKYYFDITKGNDRLLSKAEGLGRLVSSGFKIVDFKSIDGLVFFVVKKVKEPEFNLNPSYGPIYRMPRLGKNGEIIKVYKFRTMHPYSEYLQDFVLRVNGYAESGKPAEDFRIPKWGKFMRKFWLDELPQLLNVLKGDMKLVGIRPVSQRYFQDIPKEMQKLRLTQKPGCIPPYVALNRKGNVLSVLQSEKDYLQEKIKNPYTTDTKFFLKAIFNIVFNHKRSA